MGIYHGLGDIMNQLILNTQGNRTYWSHLPTGLFYVAGRLKDLGVDFQFQDRLYGNNEIKATDTIFYPTCLTITGPFFVKM